MTVILFTPSPTSPFIFQATFDGNAYTVVVTWSLAGQRYYVSVYTQQNILVLSLPMIGSPKDYDISLTGGYFTTKLIFREAERQFEIV